MTERRSRVEVTVAVESGGFFCAGVERGPDACGSGSTKPLGKRAVSTGPAWPTTSRVAGACVEERPSRDRDKDRAEERDRR